MKSFLSIPDGSEGMWKTNAYRSFKLDKPEFVAQKPIQQLLKGGGTKVVELMNTMLVNSPRISPRSLTLRINKFMASSGN